MRIRMRFTTLRSLCWKIAEQKLKFFCFCVTALFLFQAFVNILSRRKFNNVSQLVIDSSFAGITECGAFPCLGNSLCKQFDAGTIKISSYLEQDKYKYWTLFRGVVYDKNSHLRQKNCTIRLLEAEKLSWGVDFVEKKQSLKSFRHTACMQFGRLKDCNVPSTLANWYPYTRVANVKGILSAAHVRGVTIPLQCASQRLVNRIVRRSSSQNNGLVTMNGLTESEKASLLFKIKLDPGSWMQDCFPGNEGWPFGITYGACGRVAVHANYGTIRLSDVYRESWKTRVDVASQLMDIAQQLTYNDDEYLLLIHKIKIDDLVIATNRKVKIVNPDDVVVIDVFNGIEGHTSKKKVSNQVRDIVEGEESNDICKQFHYDINFHFMCKLLYGSESKQGILHDPQESAAFVGKLTTLLDVCAKGKVAATGKADVKVRISAATTITNMLRNIRPCSDKFEYRYPECKDVSEVNQPYNVPWQEVQ